MTLYFYKKVDTVLHQTECRIEAPLDHEVNDQLIKYLSSISFAVTRINELNRCKIWVNPEVYENLRTNPDTLVHLRKLGVTRWEYNETTIWEDKCND